ncbi:hypothetical protein EDC04DRAFT_2600307 [Pisolithus marmoratus]|nr:hypothetical protein EDC04DRAFT_2600307 [Pisolithus marmoratus]
MAVKLLPYSTGLHNWGVGEARKAYTPAKLLNLANRYFTRHLFGGNPACMGWLVMYNLLSLHEWPPHEMLANQMSTWARTSTNHVVRDHYSLYPTVPGACGVMLTSASLSLCTADWVHQPRLKVKQPIVSTVSPGHSRPIAKHPCTAPDSK